MEYYKFVCYRHNVDEAFEDHWPIRDFQKLTDTGLLSRACFDHLASSGNESHESQFSNEEIRGFLMSSGLATPVEGQDCLYIPSLIGDNNKKTVMNQLKQMQRDNMSLGFMFKFKKSDNIYDLYRKLICKLLCIDNQDTTTTLHKGFAAKIENRHIGEISGMWGSLSYLAPISHEFVILETDRKSTRPGDHRFARDKVI